MRLIKLVPIYILCVLLVFCESEKEIVTESSVSIARFATTPEEINQPTPTAQSYFNQGVSFDRIHRYNEAIKSFTKSIELNQDISTYYWRGESYKRSGQYQKAIDDFSVYLNANSEATYSNLYISEGYSSRGYSYYQLRKYQKALDDFNKSTELQPSNERYLRALINNAKDSLGKSQRTFN